MNEYALITGASGGLGLEFSYLCAEDGYNLILIARSEDKLRSISEDIKGDYNVNVKIICKDLSDPSSAKEIFERVHGEQLDVAILINNAGFGGTGSFAETDLKNELGMMQVNMVSLAELAKYFLPGMIAGKHGKIMNLASTAAFVPGPFMSIYYATKAFVLSFSEALTNELKRTGVTVTALCPGPTYTDFQKRANVESTRLFRYNVMDARKVALTGYRGLMKGKSVVIPGVFNKLLIQSTRFSPRKTLTAISRWLRSKRKKE